MRAMGARGHSLRAAYVCAGYPTVPSLSTRTHGACASAPAHAARQQQQQQQQQQYGAGGGVKRAFKGLARALSRLDSRVGGNVDADGDDQQEKLDTMKHKIVRH